ncbi:MAG: L-rhamnose isomerase, partial [Clostridia bacterium]|nr:L-rhamnose isomerase [Clostridia bacterium]
ILSVPYDKSKVYISVESKVFGIGVESYTAGSAEFTTGYTMKNGLVPLMDNGHYHPTELVSDKISSLLCFNEKVALHVTRGVRWDSDHVILFDDETKEMMREIVRNDALERVFIATDYFDASINRISAWVTGTRNVRKALLNALLEPSAAKKALQDKADFTSLMALSEEEKTLPFGDIWNEYLERNGMSNSFINDIKEYEERITAERK